MTNEIKVKLFEHVYDVQKTMDMYKTMFGECDELFKRKLSEWCGCFDTIVLLKLEDEYARYQINRMKEGK